MEYREKQYTVIQGIERDYWKWSIELRDGRTRSGTERNRLAAVKAAEREIDRTLAPKKKRLWQTGR
jgi:hypothetical protein